MMVLFFKGKIVLQTVCFMYPDHVRQSNELVHATAKTSYHASGDGDPSCVQVITPPKSGTHLLMKVLGILGISYKTKILGIHYAPHICQYAPNLLPYDFLDPEKLKNAFDAKKKYIVMLRDPKDFIISYIDWLGHEIEKGEIQDEPAWRAASMEEKLNHFFWGGNPKTFSTLQHTGWVIGNYAVLERLYHLALSNMLFLRFEDLVGPELGGNSKEAQVHAFKKLCEFTDTKYTDQKIQTLIKFLPGYTQTFTLNKKVGKWEDYFNEKHRAWFNYRFAPITHNLGYKLCPKELNS